jgi:hypothetical protein
VVETDQDAVLVEPPRLVGGELQAPTAPGLGVVLPDELEPHYPYRPGAVYRIPGN